MTSTDLRKKFFDFFIKKNHFLYADKGILPKNDTSLLWINAGIVPLKKYFLGEAKPPSKKLVSIQRCVRVNDIDLIGKSNSHHTLFQMLGFFSIGSYFKKTAIDNALGFLKSINIDLSKIFFTIHSSDIESYSLLKDLSFDTKKMFKLESNFWDLGSGPCGPCLEIFYDKGEKYGDFSSNIIKQEIDNDRFVEIMNIVFSSFNHVNNEYEELKTKKIDMGAGFERLLAILNNVASAYETDLFKDAILYIQKQNDNINYVSCKIIVDHLRTIYTMMAENVFPGPKNQNYIVRSLLKRIAMQIYFSHIESIVESIGNIINLVMKTFLDYTPNIFEKFSFITNEMKSELKVFLKNIEKQTTEVKSLINSTSKKTIDSKLVFKLYETKGVDLEIINEIFAKYNKSYSIIEFNNHLLEHKKKSSNRKFTIGYNLDAKFITNVKHSEFVGYNKKLTMFQTILDSIFVQNGVWLVFKQTPFYPESGGQIYDIGEIVLENEVYKVVKVIKKNDVIFHYIADVTKKQLFQKGRKVLLKVNEKRRKLIEANHSATHLLHFFLREQLGDDVFQAGSAIDERRLRFDFTTSTKFNKLQLINSITNSMVQAIKKNWLVQTNILTLDEAKQKGFLLTFLQDYLRMTKLRGVVINQSKELCVGTHVESTKEIESFLIKNFKSKGLNTYRIEALTKQKAKEYERHTSIIKKRKNRIKSDGLLTKNDIVELFYNNQHYKLFKVLKNTTHRELLSYFDQNYHSNKELIVFIYGNNFNSILVCSNNNNNRIINVLIKKGYIKGGGKAKWFMGKLLISIKQLKDELDSIILTMNLVHGK